MKRYEDYSDIDILALFDEFGVEYKTSGKNIGQNWAGVETCPFCGSGGFHLGIHLASKVSSCFVCGQKSSLPHLLKNLLDLKMFELKELLNRFGGNYQEEEVIEQAEQVIFPTRMTTLSPIARNYLRGRGFLPDQLIKKYDLQQTSMLSKLEIGTKKWDFKNRIIIPVSVDNKIVTWSARDFTGISPVRYKHAPLVAGSLPMASCVYQLDKAKRDKILLVEGPADQWRMGENSAAMFGVKYSDGQIQALVQKKFKKIVILFDAGASEPAKKLAHTLMPFTNVQVSTLFVGDPADLTETDSVKLKYYLLGY